MLKTVCFGELLLRLSPPGYERLFQSPSLGATFGGGEANVAVSLAHFGCESHYVTRVPAHAVGDAALKTLRGEGVRLDHVLRGGDRLGIYFAETGCSQRPSTVLYDRRHSAFSEIGPGQVAWSRVLQHADWFHCTGITPALGPSTAACTREALEAARGLGVTVSLDLNYRRTLWSTEEARQTMRPLMPLVDVVIANEEDLQAVLGIDVPHTDVVRGDLSLEGYRQAAERVTREHGVGRVAITLRESLSASDNAWRAVLFDRASDAFLVSQRYVVHLVDRIGGGDSFAAGLIRGLAAGQPAESALRFAVAASALKQTIPGDFNRVSVADVDRLAAGDASGRVQR